MKSASGRDYATGGREISAPEESRAGESAGHKHLDVLPDLPLNRRREEEAEFLRGPHRFREMIAAAGDARDSMSAVVDALASDDKDELDKSFDAYAEAAKSFTKLVLAERIRRSFVGKIDPDTGKSTESVDEKIEHARLIRDWLSPFNLGFVDAETGRLFQIRGMRTSAAGGQYRLGAYGVNSSPELCGWPHVKSIITSPTLGDVTRFVYRQHFRENSR